ncbi:MAG: HD domain-containing protein [Clostridia bacterium]
MSKYFESLDEQIKEYFKILSPEIPEFLEEYIETEPMQKQAGISVSCGTVYSKMFDELWYSSLDHSVAVALIVWNFTKDKKQTLAGLFHDIATPVFKHCIDFMNGDYENQESTEELTEKIIRNSDSIMKLLNRDGIKVEEISDYHIYPIADNDTPQLSADRLEYTLSNGLGVRMKLWNLDEVREIYQNIEVQKNEDSIEELGFKDKMLAEKFVNNMSKLSTFYISNNAKITMQFLADIIKKMNQKGLINKEDLYKLSEKDVIEKIENCEYDNISKCFKSWKNTTQINESDIPVEDKYCVSINAKRRYINPLVEMDNNNYVRVNQISDIAKQDIDRCLNFKTKKYAYFDFNF